jgi:hypothetical protein
MSQREPTWLPEPEDHDYPAAQDFLSLLMSLTKAEALTNLLRLVDMSEFKAKDILRASKEPRLDEANAHVRKNLRKIEQGKPLSPILLVRTDNDRLVIADGYHRVCAVYLLNEDATIPCKIA